MTEKLSVKVPDTQEGTAAHLKAPKRQKKSEQQVIAAQPTNGDLFFVRGWVTLGNLAITGIWWEKNVGLRKTCGIVWGAMCDELCLPKNVRRTWTMTQETAMVIFLIKEVSVARSSPILYDPMDCNQLLHPWNSPGQNTEVGSHCFLHFNKRKHC